MHYDVYKFMRGGHCCRVHAAVTMNVRRIIKYAYCSRRRDFMSRLRRVTGAVDLHLNVLLLLRIAETPQRSDRGNRRTGDGGEKKKRFDEYLLTSPRQSLGPVQRRF